MEEAQIVKAMSLSGEVFDLQLEISDNRRDWNLKFRDLAGNVHCYDAGDVFAALQSMREELEAQGVKLLCAGARKDVWPSGMSRDMGGGFKAYVMRFGETAKIKDLVDIFDYSDPSLVGTVQEQRDYFEAWLESLKKRT
jgi:hypothetical protein